MIGSKPNANCNEETSLVNRRFRKNDRAKEVDLVRRGLGLLTLSAGVLLVNGTNPRGAAHAQTAEHSSASEFR